MVSLLQAYCSKNEVQDQSVCLFVTSDPNILHLADSNLEAISVLDQLKKACVRRRVRKRRNAWPINNPWESNHTFLHGLTTMCQFVIPYISLLLVVVQGQLGTHCHVFCSVSFCSSARWLRLTADIPLTPLTAVFREVFIPAKWKPGFIAHFLLFDQSAPLSVWMSCSVLRSTLQMCQMACRWQCVLVQINLLCYILAPIQAVWTES